MKDVHAWVLAIGLAAGWGFTPAQADDWPRFRGVNGTGVSPSDDLPAEFGADKNVLWKVESGNGSSSPVIVDGRLYYTSYDGDQRFVICRDAETGEERWTQRVPKIRSEVASAPNGPATCTPAADGEYVVAFFPDAGLFCYTSSGEKKWQAEVGPFHSMHGIASSPMILDGRVFVLADQLAGSYFAAYELSTGDLAWKVERVDGLTGAYSTPSVFQSPDGSSQLLATGPYELIGYSPTTGEPSWTVSGATNAPVSVPVVAGGRVFLCEPVGTVTPISMLAPMDKNKDGMLSLEEVKSNVPIHRLLERMDLDYGNGDKVVDEAEWSKAFGGFVNKGGLVAIDVKHTAAGVIAEKNWTYTKTVPYVPSVIVYKDLLYFVQDDGGIFGSVDLKSGEMTKRARLKQGGAKVYASPVAGDGKIYVIDTQGNISVVQAGAEWEIIANGTLGEACFATPAIADGRIYVRGAKSLFCFGKTAGSE